MNLDSLSPLQMAELFNAQNDVAVAAVGTQSQQIADAAVVVADALGSGGRLVYFGAGTSGRLGVLDASECPPTFGSSPEQVQGIIAGGEAAMFRSQEGAEDDAADGAAKVSEMKIGEDDVVMGIAAGGTTPFVHGALRRKRACVRERFFFRAFSRSRMSRRLTW